MTAINAAKSLGLVRYKFDGRGCDARHYAGDPTRFRLGSVGQWVRAGDRAEVDDAPAASSKAFTAF
jgi:hypothetical protein